MLKNPIRNKKHLGHDRRGTAALEFAIVCPAMILMLVAMMMYGLYLTLVHEVQELASSGARASVAGTTPSERSLLAQQFISSFVAGSGLIIPADLTVTTTNGAISYQVSVSYSLKDTPIPALGQLVSLQPATIQRTATIQLGGF